MRNPYISIIIPVYNAQETIERCVRSLLVQSVKDIEILAVDDGSEDRSAEILDQIAASGGRLRVLRLAHAGVSQARNAGIDAARGKYLGFVDADDYVEPDMYESMLQSGDDAVFCGYSSEYSGHSRVNLFDFSNGARFSGAEKLKLLEKMIGPSGSDRLLPERLDFLSSVWNLIYRRELILRAGIRFVDLCEIGSCEDLLFNIAALSACDSVGYVRKAFYHYNRVNPASITACYRPDLPCKWCELYRRMRSEIAKSGLGERGEMSLQNRIGLNVLNLVFNEISNPNAGERLGKVRRILHLAPFAGAAAGLRPARLPLRWKPFYFFVRHKMAVAVIVSAYGINQIRIMLPF